MEAGLAPHSAGGHVTAGAARAPRRASAGAGAVSAAAISEFIGIGDALLWYQGALGELRATLAAQGTGAGGPPGGIFATELFADEQGHATIFVPATSSAGPWDGSGR